MKISLNWLRDYVALDASADEICRAITFLGFEVENVIRTGAPQLNHVLVGEVLTRNKHPNADKLSVCTVSLGEALGVKTIVCGAQNYTVGDRVPVALPGAVLPGDFVIKQSKIRGESSDGMMCSAKELGISEDAAGLMILADRPALGTPINAVLPPGDTVFDIEITPNRPDCLSHVGIARELAAWFKKDLVCPQGKFRGALPAGAATRQDLLAVVRVEAPEDCPLYLAHVVTGIKIGPSPAWLQQRLAAVGLRSINNVVDIGNFVMLESGQPLHAFDARKLSGAQIVVRRAVDGEKITTLDGKERTLNSSMLVIADGAKPVVIAGIMGGENSGVTAETTDLVIECAIFKRQSIRATSKRLGLTSDSAYRYERGVDAHAAQAAAGRAIDLILELAGGQLVGPIHQVGDTTTWQREITLAPAFVRERLGFDIADADMKQALEALKLKVTELGEVTQQAPGAQSTKRSEWRVTVPSWRDDLDRPIDLVEEILRVYGTERIPPTRVTVPGLVGDDDPVVLFNRRVTDYLVGHDFHECVNYTLRPGAEVKTWAAETAVAELALANPFVEDQSHLRPTLISGLLATLKLNQSRGVPVSRLCETGRVFIQKNGQNLECAAVGFIVAEDTERRWRQREAFDFYAAKHHVVSLAGLAALDLERQPLVAASGPHYGWQEGQSALAGDLQHGWTASFGLLSLAMAKAYGIEGKVYAGFFAILPEKLVAASAARKRYADFSLQPAALRDLALVVPAATVASEVQKALAKAARAAVGNAFHLESVAVFDVYQGKGLPEGTKSLAFSLVFRAPDRTLTDDEVNAAFNKIQTDVVQSTGFSIRK
jgi:phenylalanyl-tRNA synthetase beta chain